MGKDGVGRGRGTVEGRSLDPAIPILCTPGHLINRLLYSFNCHLLSSQWVARPARVAPRGAAATTTLHDHTPEKEMFWCVFGSLSVDGRARARSFKGPAGCSTTSQAFKEETQNHAHAHAYTQLPVRADQGRQVLLRRLGRHAGMFVLCVWWMMSQSVE